MWKSGEKLAPQKAQPSHAPVRFSTGGHFRDLHGTIFGSGTMEVMELMEAPTIVGILMGY